MRYKQFDLAFRRIHQCERGLACSPLIYPPAVQRGATTTYLDLGHDYEAAGDTGAAARAYWAAITLTRRAVASRPEKESLRQSAYAELARIARSRGQTRWAELLSLCHDLAGAYLATRQANQDADAFYAEMGKTQMAFGAIEDAQHAASMQAMAGMMGAMGTLNAANVASASGNMNLAMQHNLQAFGQVVQVTATQQSQLSAIEDAADEYSGAQSRFASVVADDVVEIEAGNSFLRNAAIFYLSTPPGPEPFLAVLREFSKNKPKLHATLETVGGSLTPADVVDIGQNLLELEILVARYERRGQSVPPELERQLWR